MYLKIALIFCALYGAADVQGMQCSRKSSANEGWLVNKVEDILVNCPRPILNKESESYCCYSNDGRDFSCCNFTDFIFSPPVLTTIGIAVFFILLATLIIFLVIKFLSAILDMCCGLLDFLRRKL